MQVQFRLREVVEDSKWLCHAHCLMTNYYHRVLGTPEGNLPKGMRQLNECGRRHYKVPRRADAAMLDLTPKPATEPRR